MADSYLVYGQAGSGSTAVEAALTLADQPYRLIEAGENELGELNPLRQFPALILPSGELMTESAAILIHIADSHRLGPGPDEPTRPRFLRWMAFISSQIYALYWVRDDITRLAETPEHQALVRERTAQRIDDCWAKMDQQLTPAGAYLLGDRPSVLDIYLAVVSRWGPGRSRFYVAAPGLASAARRIDSHPALAAFWAERFPFEPGWER